MLARSVLLLILLAMSVLCVATKAVGPPSGDGYELYALSMAKWGRYAMAGDYKCPPQPGFGRAPIYPLFQAAMMRLEQRRYELGRMLPRGGHQCQLRPQLLPLVQLALAVLAVFLIFEMSLVLAAPPLFGVLVTVAAAQPFLDFVYKHQVSEAIAMPLFGLASYCLMLWFVKGTRTRVLLVAGAAVGLLALTRVAYVYAMPFVAAAVYFSPNARRITRPAGRALAAAGFTLSS